MDRTSTQAAAGRRRVVVLGSTGSIGTSTLDVIDHLGDRLEAHGLVAHRSRSELLEQAWRFRPRFVALTDSDAAAWLAEQDLPPGTMHLSDKDAVASLTADPETDIVISAVVGAAGLEGTWQALEAGKTVGLANKETLVMAGPQVMELAARNRTRLLPVDSEHSAIFQGIQAGRPHEVARVVLTASGGPFRGRKACDLREVTPEEALRHPTWRMGPKITIDSATMMNKALEIIEARWLFDLAPEKIDVILHPESVVHSFVEFQDGSVLAQLSPPDMRLPIQYALTWPDRLPGPARRMPWTELARLTFEPPDPETFPALELGHEVACRGGTCGAVLNAANEAAVQAFLDGSLDFLDIPRACRAVLDAHSFSSRPGLSELRKLDRWARQEVVRWTTKKTCAATR